MRVLYLIQTFSNLPRIARLVETVRRSDPNGFILISHNQDEFSIDAASFGDAGRLHVMNLRGGNRVDFFLMDSYLAAVERARELNVDYDWVINLTGQCYPIRPLSELADELRASEFDAYIFHRKAFPEGDDIGFWPEDEARNRYLYRYLWRPSLHEVGPVLHKGLGVIKRIINHSQPWVRMDSTYGVQFGLRNGEDFLPSGWVLYGGIYFMALRRRAAEHLLDFSCQQQAITQHFRQMNIPCEVFPHTVLANNPSFRLSMQLLNFVEYADCPRGHPRLLAASDLDNLRATGAYFARKFDVAADATLLDQLDSLVLGARPGSSTAARCQSGRHDARSRREAAAEPDHVALRIHGHAVVGTGAVGAHGSLKAMGSR